MSDTPRTDAQQKLLADRLKGYEMFEAIPHEVWNFARLLERENKRLIAALKSARNATDDMEEHAAIDALLGDLGEIKDDGTFR